MNLHLGAHCGQSTILSNVALAKGKRCVEKN